MTVTDPAAAAEADAQLPFVRDHLQVTSSETSLSNISNNETLLSEQTPYNVIIT